MCYFVFSNIFSRLFLLFLLTFIFFDSGNHQKCFSISTSSSSSSSRAFLVFPLCFSFCVMPVANQLFSTLLPPCGLSCIWSPQSRARSALVLPGSVLDFFCLPGESIMAASAASRELFTEGVRAVLNTWPVLQVSTVAAGSADGRTEQWNCVWPVYWPWQQAKAIMLMLRL